MIKVSCDIFYVPTLTFIIQTAIFFYMRTMKEEFLKYDRAEEKGKWKKEERERENKNEKRLVARKHEKQKSLFCPQYRGK